jgi:hypothetical protein
MKNIKALVTLKNSPVELNEKALTSVQPGSLQSKNTIGAVHGRDHRLGDAVREKNEEVAL